MAWIENHNGLYRVVWRGDGKRNRETFSRESDAVSFKLLVEKSGGWPAGWKPREGWVEETRPTFGAMFDAYCADRLENKHRQDDTVDDYRRLCQREWSHWRPVAAESIRPEEIEAWQKQYGSTRAHKTVMNARGLLAAVFRFGHAKGYTAVDPVLAVDAPVKPRVVRTSVTDVHFFRPEHLAAIRRHLCPIALPVIDAGLSTGMRWSEYTAVRVRNVRTAGSEPGIEVLGAWKRGRKTLGATKTDAGFRIVYLSPAGAETWARIVHGKDPDDFALTTTYGQPWRSSTFHEHHWHGALAQAREEIQLPAKSEIRMLRHTYAVMMISAGMPIEALQRQMGHESLVMTNDLYGGVYDKTRAQHAQTFGAGFDLLVAG